MPIYAYRCTSCGFEKDVMQKVNDPKLTTCPECKSESFAKQLTAPQFQLKGTGWYATDFKGGNTTTTTTAKADAGSDAKTEAKAEVKTESSSADAKTGSAPAATSTVSTTPSVPSSN